MNIFFAWMLAFAPLAAFSPRKLSIFEWVLYLGFGWLALTGLRYVIWFLFIVAYFSALTGFLSGEKYPRSKQVTWSEILGLSSDFLPGIREKIVPYSIPVYEMETTPLAATRVAGSASRFTALWADYAFGGYLDFAMPAFQRGWTPFS